MTKTIHPNNTKTQSNSETQPYLSIAIIGASYAGLTLANVLQKQWKDNYSNYHNHQRDKQNTNAKNNNNHQTHQTEEQRSQLKISIFEKMGPPGSVGYVSGNLRLPSYKTILRETGIETHCDWRQNIQSQTLVSNNTVLKSASIETAKLNDNNDSSDTVIHDPYLVPQHTFTEMLRTNLQTKIEYRKQLVQILSSKNARAIYETEQNSNTKMNETFQNIPVENDDDGYYLEMKCSDNNLAKKIKDKDRFVMVTIPQYTTVYKGPFHIIIGADGVLSTCRNQLLSPTIFNHHHSPSLPIFLIGDARWVRYRWWDFGQLRIRSGADISICDGVELGKWLVQNLDVLIQYRNEKHKNVINSAVPLNYYPNRLLACTEDQMILDKFHLNNMKWKRILWETKHFFIVLLILMTTYAMR